LGGGSFSTQAAETSNMVALQQYLQMPHRLIDVKAYCPLLLASLLTTNPINNQDITNLLAF
jgi:hypothetical protein